LHKSIPITYIGGYEYFKPSKNYIFMLSDIPDVSYSSSEDDFYDAYEDEEEWSKPSRQIEPVPAMRRKYKNRILVG